MTMLMLAVLDCSSCTAECIVSLDQDPTRRDVIMTCPSCGWEGVIEVDYTYEPTDQDDDVETPPAFAPPALRDRRRLRRTRVVIWLRHFAPAFGGHL